MNKLTKELKKISMLNAPSGQEDNVREYFKEEFSKMSKRPTFDNLGSTFTKFGNKGLKIMIAAHMDEVGFMVTNITKEGFLKVTNIGGIIPILMANSLVTVLADKKEIPGVVLGLPSHLFSGNEIPKTATEDLVIDIGATSKEEVIKMGIEKGNFAVPRGEFLELSKNRISTKAIDNRFGCTLALEIARELNNDINNTVIIGATVQEEVGLRGAKTAVNKYQPDIFIAIDASSSTDYFDTKENKIELGQGFLLRHMDPRMITNQSIKSELIRICKKHKIKYQDFTSKGATDAAMAQVSLEGVPSLVVGIPIRGIHTNHCVMDLNDYKEAKKAVVKFIQEVNLTKGE